MHTLYQVQLKYLEKQAAKSSTLKSESGASQASQNTSKNLDKLVNQTPIGVFRPSQIGEPMRLYYYLSPLDLIQYNQRTETAESRFSATYQLKGVSVSAEQLIQHELGSYVTISLHSINSGTNKSVMYNLPDINLLLVSENETTENERAWHDLLNPYLNANFDSEK